MDNVQTDWNANAARTARNYLDIMPMSDGELYDQLIYEGYTPDQASFALTQL